MNAMPALPCAHEDACAGTPLFARLDARVALQALREEVDALLSSPWCDHVNHGGYEGVWRVMPLRCQRQHVAAHPILQSFSIEEPEEDWEDLPLLQHCPAIRQVLEQLQCLAEGPVHLLLRAGHGGGIFDAPVRRYRMAGPERTRLTGGLVADGDDQVHRRRIRRGEFVPGLAAQPVRRDARFVQHL